MNRVLKAEGFKERKYTPLIALNGVVMALIVLLYLWMSYLAGGNIRQEQLQSPCKAGSYGLVLFTTLFRRIWGVIYGFLIVNMELVENRTDFIIPNTGRRRLFAGKLVISSVQALVMVFLSYLLPYAAAACISHKVSNDTDLIMTVGQLLLVWFMTIGCILAGMIAALICREVLLVMAVLLTLEYFSNLYPQCVIDLWNRLDGYWYFSNLLYYTQNQLDGLENISFYLTDNFTGAAGLLVWLVVYFLFLTAGFYTVSRMEF